MIINPITATPYHASPNFCSIKIHAAIATAWTPVYASQNVGSKKSDPTKFFGWVTPAPIREIGTMNSPSLILLYDRIKPKRLAKHLRFLDVFALKPATRLWQEETKEQKEQQAKLEKLYDAYEERSSRNR